MNQTSHEIYILASSFFKAQFEWRNLAQLIIQKLNMSFVSLIRAFRQNLYFSSAKISIYSSFHVWNVKVESAKWPEREYIAESVATKVMEIMVKKADFQNSELQYVLLKSEEATATGTDRNWSD